MKSRHSLQELFDKALDYGGNTHSREDIAAGIASGRYTYFGDSDCCLITEIIDYPRCRKLHLFIAAGDLEQLRRDYLPQVKEFARENGCDGITSITPRKGFLKKCSAFGFKPKNVTFELRI
jgi:hypothetical protein